MVWEYVNNYELSNTTFSNNQEIQSINLENRQFTDYYMDNAFVNCTNLLYVTNINQNIITLNNAFENCSNLVITPKFTSEGLHNPYFMERTFYGCSKITTTPIIPSSIATMYKTFDGCVNLKGIIKIESKIIYNAIDCFANTSLRKNVFIPFYDNGIETQTYTAFKRAGYSDTIRKNGVLLYNLR